MNLRRFRPVAVALIVLHLNACTSWKPISLQTGPPPEKVRVTTETDRFVLNDTRLVGDTAIAGTWSGRPTDTHLDLSEFAGGLRTVRLTDALYVERASFSPLRTVGLVAGIGFAALLAAIAIACSGGGCAY